MLTDPGVDRGAAHSGSERLSAAFSVGDRDGLADRDSWTDVLDKGWPTWQGSSNKIRKDLFK